MSINPDPAKIRALATEWRNQADRLKTLRQKLATDFNAMTKWRGAGQVAGARVITATAQKVADMEGACRKWADNLDEMAKKVEEKIEKERIASIVAIFTGIFSILLIPLSFVLGPLLGSLAGLLVGLANLGRVASYVANLVLDLALGILVYGTLQLGIEMAGEAIAHLSVTGSASFTPSPWMALNVGLAALLGGLFSIRTWKLPPKTTGNNSTVLDVPAVGNTTVPQPEVGGLHGAPPPSSMSGGRVRSSFDSTIETTSSVSRSVTPPRNMHTADIPSVTSPPLTGRPPIGGSGQNFDVGGGSPAGRAARAPDVATGGDIVNVPTAVKPTPPVRPPAEIRSGGTDPALGGPRDITPEPGRPFPNGSKPGGTPPLRLETNLTHVSPDQLPGVPLGGGKTPQVEATPPTPVRPATSLQHPDTTVLPQTGRNGVELPRMQADQITVGAPPASPKAVTPPSRPTEITLSPQDAPQVPHTKVGAEGKLPSVPSNFLKPPPKTPANLHTPTLTAPEAVPGGVTSPHLTTGGAANPPSVRTPTALQEMSEVSGGLHRPAGTVRSPEPLGTDINAGKTPVRSEPLSTGRPDLSTGGMSHRPVAPEMRSPTAEIRTPGPEVRAPASEIRTPGPEVRTPTSEIRTPGPEVRAPASEIRTPGPEVRTPASEVRSPAADLRTPGNPDRTPAHLQQRDLGSEASTLSRRPVTPTESPHTTGTNSGRTTHSTPLESVNSRADLAGAAGHGGTGGRGRPSVEQPATGTTSRDLTPAPPDSPPVGTTARGRDVPPTANFEAARAARAELDSAVQADGGAAAGKGSRALTPAEAAKALREAQRKALLAEFWPSVKDGIIRQFRWTATEYATTGHSQLTRFANHFAAEAGVAKELPAIRNLIDEKFATLVQGEMSQAVRTVAADIATRAGMPTAQVAKLTGALVATERQALAQALKEFRSGLRDFRAGRPVGERPVMDESLRTAEQSRLLHQSEKDAAAWAKQRDKEFGNLSKEIGRLYQPLRRPAPVDQPRLAPEPKSGLTGAARDAHWAEVRTALDDSHRLKVASAATVEKLRPNAVADFDKAVQRSAEIAGMSRSRPGSQPRLPSLESLPPEATAELRMVFRDAVDEAFNRIWRPVIEAGLGSGSARFTATAAHWKSTYNGMQSRLQVEGMVFHELKQLEDEVRAVASAVGRNPRGADMTAVLQEIRSTVQADMTAMVRQADLMSITRNVRTEGIEDLVRHRKFARGDWITMVDQHVSGGFTVPRPAGPVRPTSGPADPVLPEPGPTTGFRMADNSPPAAPTHHPDLTKQRNAAVESFGRLDSKSLAQLPEPVAGRLTTAYVQERLLAFDQIFHGGRGVQSGDGLVGLARGADVPPTAAPTRLDQYARLDEVITAHNLGAVRVPSGIVVHSGAAGDGLSKLVNAARSFTEIPGRTRVFLGPGVEANFLADVGSRVGRNLVVHAPLVGESQLAALGERVGLTGVLHGRPAAADLGRAVPVDHAGHPTFPHAAVEWHSPRPGSASGTSYDGLPVGLEHSGRPGAARLAEGWTLEWHSWGVWARPPDVSAADALPIRAGQQSDGSTMVVGTPDVVVPPSVAAQVRDLAHGLPTPGGSPAIRWLSTEGRIGDEVARPGPTAAEFAGRGLDEKYAGALDFARTRDLLRKQMVDDIDQAEPFDFRVFGSEDGAVAVRQGIESDVDKLVTTYLGKGGAEGWHEFPDVAGFVTRYAELRIQMAFRFEARSLMDEWLPRTQAKIDEAFAGNRWAQNFESLLGAGGRAEVGALRNEFSTRFNEMLRKSADDVALDFSAGAGQAGRDGSAFIRAVDERLTTMLHSLPQRVEYFISGNRSIHYASAADGVPASNEVRTVLGQRIRQQHEELFGRDGELSMERWKPGAEDPDAAFSAYVGDMLTPDQVGLVMSRFDQAHVGLRAADPAFDLAATESAARIVVAATVVTRVEQMVADRALARLRAGLPDDLTPQQVAEFRNTLIARVDAELRTGNRNVALADIENPQAWGDAWRLRFEELTGPRLVEELNLAAQPDRVRQAVGLLERDLLDDIELNAAFTLGDTGRVLDVATTRLTRAYDELQAAGLTPREFDAEWNQIVRNTRAGLDDWLEGDFDAQIRMSRAADDFHRIERADLTANRSALPQKQLDDLAAGYRADYLAEHSDLPRLGNLQRWLEHEHQAGNKFWSSLHASRIQDLNRQLSAELATVRNQLAPDQDSLPLVTAASAKLERDFANGLHTASHGAGRVDGGFVTRAQKNLTDFTASLESRLTIQMLELRASATVDRFVTQRHSQLSSADQVQRLDKVANDVKAELSSQFRATLGQQTTKLPPSMGRSDQELLLTEIGRQVDKKFATAPAEIRKLTGDLRSQVTRSLVHDPVPVRQDAGYDGHRQRLVTKLNAALDQETAQLQHLDPSDTSIAERVNGFRDDLLADLDGMHQKQWTVGWAALDWRYTELIGGLQADLHRRAVSANALPQIERTVDDHLAEAYGRLALTEATRAATEAAGAAFRQAVIGDFQKIRTSPGQSIEDAVENWRSRYGQLAEKLDSWLTVRVLRDRMVAQPGVATNVVDQELSRYLDVSGRSALPVSLGVDDQIQLAKQVTARLDANRTPSVSQTLDANRTPSVSQTLDASGTRDLVRNIAAAPVPVRRGAGFDGEQQQLAHRIDVAIAAAADKPGQGAAAAAFKAHLLEEFTSVHRQRWDFDRGSWERTVLEPRLADASDVIAVESARLGAWAKTERAITERLTEVAATLSGPRLQAAVDAFRAAVREQFAADHPTFTTFGPEQALAWESRVPEMLTGVQSWLVVHQMHAGLVLADTTLPQADRRAWLGQREATDRRLLRYLDLSRPSSLPPSMGLDEQLRLAAEVTGRKRYGDTPSFEPVPVSEQAGIVGDRADLESRLDARVADLVGRRADVPTIHTDAEALRTSVLGDLDDRYRSAWNFNRAAWQQHLTGRLSERSVDAWIDARLLRAEELDHLSDRLDVALAGADNEAADAVRQALIREFERRHPGADTFSAEASEAWRGRVDQVLAALDSWLAGHARLQQIRDEIESAMALPLRAWSDQRVPDWELDQLRTLGAELRTAVMSTQPAITAARVLGPVELVSRVEQTLVSVFDELTGRDDIGPGLLALTPRLRAAAEAAIDRVRAQSKGPATAATRSAEASGKTESTSPVARPKQWFPIPADGNCLFHSVVDSALRQGVALPPGVNDMASLRAYATKAVQADPGELDSVFSVGQLVVDDLRSGRHMARSDFGVDGNPSWDDISQLIDDGVEDVLDRLRSRAGTLPLVKVVLRRLDETRHMPTAKDLMVEAMAGPALWNTSIGDAVPEVLARLLDINIVVVEGDSERALNPDASQTLYVQRVSRNHYQSGGPASNTRQASPSHDMADETNPALPSVVTGLSRREVQVLLAENRPDFAEELRAMPGGRSSVALDVFRRRAEALWERLGLGHRSRAELDAAIARFRQPWVGDGGYGSLLKEFQIHITYEQKIAPLLTDDPQAAARQRWSREDPALVTQALEAFERDRKAAIHQAFAATHQWDWQRAVSAAEVFVRIHAALVGELDKYLAAAKEAAAARKHAAETFATAVEQRQEQEGTVLDEAAVAVAWAGFERYLTTHPRTGARQPLNERALAESEPALRNQLDMAVVFSRFTAALASFQLPVTMARTVIRNGLDVYTRLLGRSHRAEPASAALLHRSLDSIEAELPARMRFDRQTAQQLIRLMDRISVPELRSHGLEPQQADIAHRLLIEQLRTPVRTALTEAADQAAVLRFAPDQADRLARDLGSRFDALVASSIELDPAPGAVIRDVALRDLLASDAGRDYLVEPEPHVRDRALVDLAGSMDAAALAALPALVGTLPRTDAQELALAAILADVRRYLDGAQAALDDALTRAAQVRSTARATLMEHVMMLSRTHPELSELAARIMDC
ncbi:hypothetical protein GCM10027280_62240 [Micromonospora polyrhachis]|uniref:Outer membrane channel protein CpnT-like N-terminal domain-containing protein n=1 Tax=Micromonospora polyrhachis TaxID=1282883 RepID=A0A7W7WP61_9ACTN|nr:hypothetical protein [Micromonospora polyrhachis]MBB4958876.1 hypothetical protein [Micromonospora polyrhachis]